VPAVAEILCQGCGARRTTAIPPIARPWLVPLCECGARPEVVRVSRVAQRPRRVSAAQRAAGT